MNDLIGLKLEEKEFHVDGEKIKNFSNSLGFENSIFSNEKIAQSNGFKNIIAPPTFPIAIDLWGGYSFDYICEKLTLNKEKVLHAQQDFKYEKFISKGDTITFFGTIKNVISKKRMNLIILAIQYFNQNNERILTSEITIAELK